MEEQIRSLLKGFGVADVGFSCPQDAPGGLPCAITLVVRLSDAIVDEISGRPTHTYFNHYRTVNFFLDQMLLQTGFLLQRNGWQYLTIPASQSVNLDNEPFSARYSHKKAAVLAGLGTIGKNALFLHNTYGPRVRLATLFTDCPLQTKIAFRPDPCPGCNRCVKACPAGAISGREVPMSFKRDDFFSPKLCSEHMKNAYQMIGRGAVCGICMQVCPVGKPEPPSHHAE